MIDVIIGASLIGMILMTVDWGVHISQTQQYSRQSGWAGFRQFKREFDKAEWIHKESWKYSLFSEDYGKYECHANIVKFNHNGMTIHNPISYFIAKQYARNYIRKNFIKPQRVKW